MVKFPLHMRDIIGLTTQRDKAFRCASEGCYYAGISDDGDFAKGCGG